MCLTLKKYTHVECIEDITENDNSIVIFEKGELIKISGFDYRSLVFYLEVVNDQNGMLTDEITIQAGDKRFKFLTL